jgi:hypothetical protein
MYDSLLHLPEASVDEARDLSAIKTSAGKRCFRHGGLAGVNIRNRPGVFEPEQSLQIFCNNHYRCNVRCIGFTTSHSNMKGGEQTYENRERKDGTTDRLR